jgi:quinol monooxygenase YgiN
LHLRLFHFCPPRRIPMIVYAVQLYRVDAVHLPEFVAAFRPRGLWSEIARLQLGHIHTDLLRNPSDPTKFLTIDFWTSIRALLAARRSPEVRSFARWLGRQAIDCEGLGMFVFPPQPTSEDLCEDALTRTFGHTATDERCESRRMELGVQP